jgi:hypothetical protein
MAGIFDEFDELVRRVKAGFHALLARPIGGRVGGRLRVTKLPDGSIRVACKQCGFENAFDQPYPFHAGFGDQGFLYNDAGDLTLTWSTYDPAYTKVLGPALVPWALDGRQRSLLEQALLPAPHGGQWRFTNPARCTQCHKPLSGPITDTIYYLRYAGSPDTERPERGGVTLSECLKNSA